MKKNLIILIGAPGSGKSTYTQKYKKDEKCAVLSSDEYRLKLFGDLKNHQSSEENKQVFKNLNNDMRHYIKDDNQIQTIILDATNLSRKRRAGLFNQYNHLCNITCIVFFTSIFELIKRNKKRKTSKQVPERIIKEMFKNMQTPVIGYDCHNIQCEGEKWFNEFNCNDIKNLTDIKKFTINNNIIDILNLNYSPHYSKWHDESIDEHIKMTIATSKNYSDKYLIYTAIFHDLGKGLSQKFTYKDNAVYHGHENIGGQLALNYAYSINKFLQYYPISILASYHMLKQNEIKKSKFERMLPDESMQNLLSQFNKIDNVSRISNMNTLSQS